MTKAKSKSIQPEIAAARRVLAKEIEGLEALDKWLGKPFCDAIELLYNRPASGRVIVSGMGKSGHIARKIAATMASTGTPAYFVHPGEASHGDLGMVARDDVLILLSNSGETKELTDIIEYSRRFSIPLIGIVRRKTSMLVDAADVALCLPDTPEACNVDAPTTSTTMMLALGDALAVALLERKGFSTDDFRNYHPGGKLGSALLRVKDLMHTSREIPLVAQDVSMQEALIEMTAKSLGCVGIVDKKGSLVGIITDGDLRRHMSEKLLHQSTLDIMTKKPITTTREALASQVLAVMEKRSITALFVLEDKKPVGIIHIHDILRAGVI